MGSTFFTGVPLHNSGEATALLTRAAFMVPGLDLQTVPMAWNPPLVPGLANQEMWFEVRVPATAPVGLHSTAFGFGGRDANDGRPIAVETGVGPDLLLLSGADPVVSAWRSPPTASCGQTFLVTVTLENQGGSAALVSGATLTFDGDGVTSALLPGHAQQLEGGARGDLRFQVTVTAWAAPGPRAMLFRLVASDLGTSVDVSRQQSLTPPVLVQRPCGLALGPYLGPVTAQGTESFEATVVVSNTGQAPARLRSACLGFGFDPTTPDRLLTAGALDEYPLDLYGGCLRYLRFQATVARDAVLGLRVTTFEVHATDLNSGRELGNVATLGSLRIVPREPSIELPVLLAQPRVSQGQAFAATVVVRNGGAGPALLDSVTVTFGRTLASAGYVTAEALPGNPTRLEGFATGRLGFTCHVSSEATPGDWTPRVSVSARDELTSLPVGRTNTLTSSVQVQRPALLRVRRVTSPVAVVSQGQIVPRITMEVENDGEAAATLAAARLLFNQSTSGYSLASVDLPARLAGGARATGTFTVLVLFDAPLGLTTLDGILVGRDENDPARTLPEATADVTASWTVERGSRVRIAGVAVDRRRLSLGQTVTCQVTLFNAGEAAVRIRRADLTPLGAQVSATSIVDALMPQGPAATELLFALTGTAQGSAALESVLIDAVDANTGTSVAVPEAMTAPIALVVESRPALVFRGLSPGRALLSRGQSTTVTLAVENTGRASVVVDALGLTFNGGQAGYAVAVPPLPRIVSGLSMVTLPVQVTLTSEAPLGPTTLGAWLRGSDGNDRAWEVDDQIRWGNARKQIWADDGENGAGNFSFEGGWGMSRDRAVEGYAFTLSPIGDYANDADATLTSRALGLGDATCALLQYDESFDLAGTSDTGWVEASAGQNAFAEVPGSRVSGRFAPFRRVQIPIAGLSGLSSLRFRFRFRSDGAGTAAGWFLDNLALFSDASPSWRVQVPAALSLPDWAALPRVSRGQFFPVPISVRNTGEASAVLEAVVVTPTDSGLTVGPLAVNRWLAGGAAAAFGLRGSAQTDAPAGLHSALLEVRGRDANSGLPLVVSQVLSPLLAVEAPAQLRLSAIGLGRRRVSVGQSFDVDLTVRNLGEAAAMIGSVEARLNRPALITLGAAGAAPVEGGGEAVFSSRVKATGPPGLVVIEGARVGAVDVNSGAAASWVASPSPTASVEVQAAPRLVLTDLRHERTLLGVDETSRVTASFRNDGGATAQLQSFLPVFDAAGVVASTAVSMPLTLPGGGVDTVQVTFVLRGLRAGTTRLTSAVVDATDGNSGPGVGLAGNEVTAPPTLRVAPRPSARLGLQSPRYVVDGRPVAVTLDARGSTSPDAGPLTYSWKLVSGQLGMPPGASSPTLTVSAASVGRRVFQLEVRGREGLTATTQAGLDVQANASPAIEVPLFRSSVRGWPVLLEGRALDPDGDVVHYTWRFVPDALRPAPATTAAVWEGVRFTPVEVGDYRWELTASDSREGSRRATVSVEVRESTTGSLPIARGLSLVSLPITVLATDGHAYDLADLIRDSGASALTVLNQSASGPPRFETFGADSGRGVPVEAGRAYLLLGARVQQVRVLFGAAWPPACAAHALQVPLAGVGYVRGIPARETMRNLLLRTGAKGVVFTETDDRGYGRLRLNSPGMPQELPIREGAGYLLLMDLASTFVSPVP
ncbi:MAG: hypothetical protein HY814_08190 [Candidatus Riflebacteria bacterium]|nr:hypothetical protein [Candidatus Riflebacteria bacterium]